MLPKIAAKKSLKFNWDSLLKPINTFVSCPEDFQMVFVAFHV